MRTPAPRLEGKAFEEIRDEYCAELALVSLAAHDPFERLRIHDDKEVELTERFVADVRWGTEAWVPRSLVVLSWWTGFFPGVHDPVRILLKSGDSSTFWFQIPGGPSISLPTCELLHAVLLGAVTEAE